MRFRIVGEGCARLCCVMYVVLVCQDTEAASSLCDCCELVVGVGKNALQ